MDNRENPADAPAGTVTLGEDAYQLLRIYCPFCGKPEREGCEHRLFATELDSIERIRPEFSRFISAQYGLGEDERIDESALLPRGLWGRFRNVAELAADAAGQLDRKIPEGPGTLTIRIVNRRRHDRREVCFASPLALAALRRLNGGDHGKNAA